LNFNMGDEDDAPLPAPVRRSPDSQPDDRPIEKQDEQDLLEEERQESISEETAAAPQRRARPIKRTQVDERTELQNKDLGDWSANYLDNMAQMTRAKQARATAQGQKNAAFWVLGQGIGGVQANFGDDREPHPLAVFSGQALLDALLGSEGHRSPTSSKRARSSSPSEEEDRRVRARNDDDKDVARGNAESSQVMGYDDEGMMMPMDDFNPESEVGRRAGSSIPDVASVLPWNRSASRQGSAQPLFSAGLGISSSIGGPGSGMKFGPGHILGGMRSSRMGSSSPLGGKGRPLMDLDDLLDLADQQAGDDMAMIDEEAFEQYGPSAAVDTQTAAQSQWLRNTLESEAQNFLGFVEAQLIERGEEEEPAKSITLDQLLPPAENSGVVAAQALLHVLALTTKGLLQVEQEEEFGDIVLKVVRVQPEASSQLSGEDDMVVVREEQLGQIAPVTGGDEPDEEDEEDDEL
jgi:meiotic recombination protein REC8, fungi type